MSDLLRNMELFQQLYQNGKQYAEEASNDILERDENRKALEETPLTTSQLLEAWSDIAGDVASAFLPWWPVVKTAVTTALNTASVWAWWYRTIQTQQYKLVNDAIEQLKAKWRKTEDAYNYLSEEVPYMFTALDKDMFKEKSKWGKVWEKIVDTLLTAWDTLWTLWMEAVDLAKLWAKTWLDYYDYFAGNKIGNSKNKVWNVYNNFKEWVTNTIADWFL